MLLRFAKAAEDTARSAEDFELWKKWDAGGRKPADIRPLLRRFDPMIRSHAATYMDKGLMVPPAAIMAEYKKQLFHALNTYDPKAGASLGTHVYTNLKAVSRFIAKHQNIARIPETRIFDIGKMRQVSSELEDRLGRAPTTREIAKAMGRREKDVVTLRKELRKDLSESAFRADITKRRVGGVRQAIDFTRAELTGRDLAVLDGLLKGIPSTTLAKRLKTSKATVSRSKAFVTEKLRANLQKYGEACE